MTDGLTCPACGEAIEPHLRLVASGSVVGHVRETYGGREFGPGVRVVCDFRRPAWVRVLKWLMR